MSDPKQAALDRVLAALGALGEAAPAAIAEHAAMAYSSTTPKLRALETSGLAERVTDDTGKTLWKLTATGVLAAVVTTGNTDSDSAKTGDVEPDTEPEVSGDTAHAPIEDGAQAPATVEDQARDEQVVPNGRIAPAGPASCDTDDGAGYGEQPDPDGDPAPAASAASPTVAADLMTDEPVPVIAQTPSPSADEPTAEAAGEPAEPTSSATGGSDRPRRRGGSLREAVLKVLQDQPGERFKVAQLCTHVDAANTGTGTAKASAGAVHNALDKLVGDGLADKVIERPATFQAAKTVTATK